MPIISGNSIINNVHYSGYTISKIYACGGSLVWEKSAETIYRWVKTDSLTCSEGFKARRFGLDGSESVIECNLSPTLTTGEMQKYGTMIVSLNSWTKLIVEPCTKRIESLCCAGASNLTSVTISEGVEEIGDAAFGRTPKLSKVTIPSTVKRMEGQTFGGRMSSDPNVPMIVTIYATTPPTVDYWPLPADEIGSTAYVPDESLELYRTAIGWRSYPDKIKPISEKTD